MFSRHWKSFREIWILNCARASGEGGGRGSDNIGSPATLRMQLWFPPKIYGERWSGNVEHIKEMRKWVVPNRGIASETWGRVSATRFRNTVSDSKIVTPETIVANALNFPWTRNDRPKISTIRAPLGVQWSGIENGSSEDCSKFHGWWSFGTRERVLAVCETFV